MTQPVVSIVLPTFNRLEFLPATVESVLAQTFTEWELIIVDDGSSAPTRDYLLSLTDPRVRIIWLRHTGRPSLISNVAIHSARGKYIAFLDSDDLWLPRKLEAQVASLRLQPDRLWSYTRFALIDASGIPLASTRDRDRPVPAGPILVKLLRSEAVIAQPSVLVAKSMLEKIGAFDENLIMCYDDDLWLRIADNSDIDSIDEPLTLVRRHSHHSGSDIQAWRDRKRVFEKAFRRNQDRRLTSDFRRMIAQMCAGLAKSQARNGKRLDAIVTLLTCVGHCWRFPMAWLAAAVVIGSRFAPQSVRSLVVVRRG